MLAEVPSKRTRFPVYKLVPQMTHCMVLRSRRAFTFHSHWLGKRSYLCPGDDCPACYQGVGAKWRGIFAADIQRAPGQPRLLALIELTEQAYYKFEFTKLTCGLEDFLGLHVHCERKTKRAPLRVTDGDTACESLDLRGEITQGQMCDAVATLFALPTLEPGETVDVWASRTKGHVARLIGATLAKTMS